MKHNKTLAVTGLVIALFSAIAKGNNPELPIDLGSADDFVVLAKTGISIVPTGSVTGDMGVSPVAATAITAFTLIMDPLGTFSTSAQVNGKIYAADYAVPTPTKMTIAISDMETAFTQASLRTLPEATELMSGNISGLTITPGLYKWSTGVLINTDVWIDAGGNPDAIFIFQIAGDLGVASAAHVILAGAAQAKNIFWQVEGGAGAVIGTTAHVEGVIMTAKQIILQAGATFNGKLLAQTAVNLNSNIIMDSRLIPSPVKLEIRSEHGVGDPATGVYFHVSGTLLTNSISAVETLLGGTQYVNTGWNMVGNSDPSGFTNSMTMIHTNMAVLTWQWSTNYVLTLTSTNGLILGAEAGWKPADSNYTLSVQADPGYIFDHWELEGMPAGSGVPLTLTMDTAKHVVAVFRSLIIDVTSEVSWSVTWVFDARKGCFIGALTIENTNAVKILTGPVWFQVETTAWHWLRYPTGINSSTGIHYLDITASVLNQLPGIGNADLILDPGESVTVSGIELMGRRMPEGLLIAVWADPPELVTQPVDTDGDGVPDVDEYVAGTSAVDPDSVFRIRLGSNGRSVEWDSKPNRCYTVLTSTNLSQGFTVAPDNITSSGKVMSHPGVSYAAEAASPGIRFFRVNVNLK